MLGLQFSSVCWLEPVLQDGGGAGMLLLTDQRADSDVGWGFWKWAPGSPSVGLLGEREGLMASPSSSSQALCGLAQSWICPEEGTLFLILLEALKGL